MESLGSDFFIRYIWVSLYRDNAVEKNYDKFVRYVDVSTRIRYIGVLLYYTMIRLHSSQLSESYSRSIFFLQLCDQCDKAYVHLTHLRRHQNQAHGRKKRDRYYSAETTPLGLLALSHNDT